MPDTGNKDLMRTLIVVAAVIYVISPIDLMPGVPFDDIMAVVMAAMNYKKLGGEEKGKARG